MSAFGVELQALACEFVAADEAANIRYWKICLGSCIKVVTSLLSVMKYKFLQL